MLLAGNLQWRRPWLLLTSSVSLPNSMPRSTVRGRTSSSSSNVEFTRVLQVVCCRPRFCNRLLSFLFPFLLSLFLRQKWGCQVMQSIFGCPIWSSFSHPTGSFWRSLDCVVVRFYFSIFSSLGSFQQSPSDVQLMPANELCLPACLPTLHIQYVLKMMEHVIVGFVFFLGFWNEMNIVKFLYIS